MPRLHALYCYIIYHIQPFGFTQGQISQIWHFLIALGLEIFGLAFWHFFGFIGRVWS